MHRSAAIEFLAPTHALALALDDDGLDETTIAARLDLDARAVGPLLRIARAKLAALEALPEPHRTGRRQARGDRAR